MKLLAIETSTKNLSLAILKDEGILKRMNFTLDKILSDKIVRCIDKILKSSNIQLKELDAFAVGLGPGSFTSLRIGLATVKGLSFAYHKPIIGIPSLDIIAMNVKEKDKQVCVISDAKRKLVFSCLYKKNKGKLTRTTKYSLSDIKDVLCSIKEPTIFVGDGVGLYGDMLKGNKNIIRVEDEKKWFPEAGRLAMLSIDRLRRKKVDNINKVVPLYLYPKDCQVRR